MSMSNSHAVNLINAQAKGITLAKAMTMLEEARRYVGQSNSTRAMDLSREMLEFIADYRKATDSQNTGG